MYKLAVVGRGLIGSAAARHLAEQNDGVVAIGPDEPDDRASHTGVFASHYDEGRATRIIDPFDEWSVTAKASIDRYADLEARSGVRFFTPAGYLGIGGPDNNYNARCAPVAKSNGAALETLDAASIRSRYSFLAVPDDADGLIEENTAGFISPRSMVAAQMMLAANAGARIVREEARAIRPSSRGVEIELGNSTFVSAERVLIAAGVFTDLCGLSPIELGLTVFGRTTVFARIEGAVAHALVGMPTLIHCAMGAYILPPIQYADGYHYVKIGIGTDFDPTFDGLGALKEWFAGKGSADNASDIKQFLLSLMPVLNDCQHWHTDACAVTATRSGLPIIDFVFEDRVAVAVGGNGKGAKGADEWGRVAALLLSQRDWDSSVPREKLRAAAEDVL